MISHQSDPLRSQLTEQPRNNLSSPSIKTEDYESKISELSKLVKILRQKLENLEQKDHNSFQNKQTERELNELQVENARLSRENKALRVRVHDLQKKLQGNGGYNLATVRSQGALREEIARSMPEGFRQRQFEKGESTVKTTQLLRELLAECNEPDEGGRGHKPLNSKDEFYQFRSSEDCFEPWLGQLPRQLRIRLKRCLTRQKQLLWADTHAELGCICPYQTRPEDPPHLCRLLLVLTNTSPSLINNVVIAPLFAKDIVISRKGKGQERGSGGKWLYPKNILSNQQLKEELEIVVNSIDFRCVQMEVSFDVQGSKISQLLILSISKGKLFRWVPYTAPPKTTQKIERVFDFEKKVLSEASKVSKLWGVVEGKEKIGGGKYYWKILFLGKPFWVEMGRVEEKLMVGVRFDNERVLGEKVLDEYVFLFQKL